MGTGYNRTDTTNNIATGNIINASDLDAEYDAIDAAFDETTGHDHGGASGNGAPITKVGPVQDLVVSASSVTPKTTNTLDLGTPLLKFKDLNLAGNALITGTLGVTGNTTLAGTIISDNTTDSTSTTTGAIQTDGGLGVAKALWVGGLANIAGAVTLQSTLNVTGVTTLTAQPILSSLTASRAVFTDASKGLVSNALTGTGNVVMSASPTLTGTAGFENITASGTLNVTGVTTLGAGAILNTPASVTLTNATGLPISSGVAGLGTGVAIALAVNIGSAGAPVLFNGALGTPSSGTVTNLTGTASININGTVGATTANTGAFTNLAYTGTLTGGTGVVNLGSGQFYKTADGKVGIGTTSPSNQFAVSNAGAMGLEIVPTGGVTSAPALYSYNRSGAAWAPLTYYANYHVFGVSGTTEAMRIDSSGNVGIGVIPNAWYTGSSWKALQVSNAAMRGGDQGAGFYANLYVDGSLNNIYRSTAYAGSYVIASDIGAHIWYTAPSGTAGATATLSERMRIDSSGNVLVGTTAVLAAGGGRGNITINGSTDSVLAFGTGGTLRAYVYAASDHLELDSQSGYMRFNTGSTERMRLDTSGNVGIGTSSPAYKLDIQTAGNGVTARASSGNAYLRLEPVYGSGASYIDFAASGSTAQDARIIGGSGSTSNLAFLTGGASLTERMRIDSAGNVGIGTSSPATRLVIGGSTGNYGLQIAARTDFAGLSGQLLITDSSGSACFTTASGSLSIGLGATVGTNSGTERVKLPIAGGLQVVNSVSVGNATPTTSGAGITFPATQSASSDANTLDDYEEGTFTPSLDNAGTISSYTNRVGKYVKIGSYVYCEIYITAGIPSPTGAAVVEVSGLPFTTANSASNFRTGSIFPVQGFGGTWSMICLDLQSNATKIQFYRSSQTTGQNYSSLTGSNLGSSVDFRLAISYTV